MNQLNDNQLTQWGVIGKIVLSNFQEPSVLSEQFDTRLELFLCQRIEDNVNSTTSRGPHDGAPEVRISRVSKVWVIQLGKSE